MKVITLLTCCALCVAGTALAQSPGSETQNRQATQERQTPQAQATSNRHSSQSRATHPTQADSTPPSSTASDRTARQTVPARSARAASPADKRPERVAGRASCTREADARHLTGHRRTSFLEDCRPGDARR